MPSETTTILPSFPSIQEPFTLSEPAPMSDATKPAAKAKKGTRVRRGIQNKELTAAQAGAMVDAIEAVENAKEDAEAAAPTKRVRVRNVKAETLPAASAKGEVAVIPQVAGMYRLPATPGGRKLFTYTLAVFTVLGMFSAHRKAVPAEAITAFFRSKKILKHHAPNLEETKDGKVRLSVAGWNYFHGRITGSTYAQMVDKPEMEALAEALRHGELTKATERFSTATHFIPIKAS